MREELKMSDFNKSVAVVSHDAGGAEVLSSYIKQHNIHCNYCLAGPALKIFQRKLGDIKIISSKEAIDHSDSLLCSTSWQSDLEWESIKIARKCNKKSIAFLDHWGNYRERFIRNGEASWPDEVWVGDSEAEILANKVLPEVIVKQIENPYFAEIKRELNVIAKSSIRHKNELSLLFVSEPLREHGIKGFGNELHWGYTEEEGLHYLLSNLYVFNNKVGRIVIRPHPSEAIDKFDWASNEYSLPIENGGRKTLLEEIVECDVVVGFQSMALVVGVLAGKRVISCIPEGGKACSLLQPEIEYLQFLVSAHC
jgi:hypothetical protein